jgi:hypothetical protein
MSLGWSYSLAANPNPATGSINLAITEVTDTLVTVATTTSQTIAKPIINNQTKLYLYEFNTSLLVKKWFFAENSNLYYNLNISGIKPGVYLLKMERDNKNTSTKIIVQ